MRHYSPFDQFLIHADKAFRTIAGSSPAAQRENPSTGIEEVELSEQQRKHIAGLMRINHAGEVSAQALYQGQAITSRREDLKDKLDQAADEENDHLAWTADRLEELGDRTSMLKPVWYLGSLGIGAAAGILGDKWNLGFLAETEKQVVKHLESHLDQIPEGDRKSRAIIEQMITDEESHATTALENGAAELPPPVKKVMGLMSKVMTKTAYHL